MLTRRTASASVSVTVEPLTATGFVSARLTALPFTVTAKSVPAGFEPAASSRPPSKVIVSSSPSTAAEEKAGGVLLVTAQPALMGVGGTRLPERSLIFWAESATMLYSTVTVWPCRAAVANVKVTVRRETETPVAN